MKLEYEKFETKLFEELSKVEKEENGDTQRNLVVIFKSFNEFTDTYLPKLTYTYNIINV
jgi:hypothetical protein